jgi:hypothetical protein
VARDRFAAYPDADFAEVNLGFAARQMCLRHERAGVSAAVFGADFGKPSGDVGPHHPIGDIGHAVLAAQPDEDTSDRVALLVRSVEVGDEDGIDDGCLDARVGYGARCAGHADASAAWTVRQPTPWRRWSSRPDTPARASRRIAAYNSTRAFCDISTCRHCSNLSDPRACLAIRADVAHESGLDLDVVDVECDERRGGQRSITEASWAHPPAGGKDESVELPVLVAIVGCPRPRSDRLGNVVVSVEKAAVVDIEGLLWGMGVDVGREADLKTTPRCSCF